jgi:hypothetical protein
MHGSAGLIGPQAVVLLSGLNGPGAVVIAGFNGFWAAAAWL